MILRKADRDTEAGVMPSSDLLAAMGAFCGQMAEAGILRAGEGLHPSAKGVRLTLSNGRATLVDGPFADTNDMIAGFSIIDVASKQEAIDWIKRWPALDGGGNVVLEIRETGCPGGCAEVQAQPLGSSLIKPQGLRFVVLLRSSFELENEAPVAQEKLEALDAHNVIEARAGVLLAADGLRGSALGARVKLAGGKPTVMDGPFTEIKEMIAGYWLIRVASLQEAIAWARRNPYPCGPEVEVEIRQVFEPADFGVQFTPEMRAAEERMRLQQLEAGMQAQMATVAPDWR